MCDLYFILQLLIASAFAFLCFLFIEVSASCRIKNIPDVNKKLTNHAQSQNVVDIHVHGNYLY